LVAADFAFNFALGLTIVVPEVRRTAVKSMFERESDSAID
jgi:hypothetical protein